MPILLAAAMLAAPMPAAAMLAPPCAPRDLAVTTDARDGDFNGMSHSGTYLIVRNRGARTCTLPGLPGLSFRDARGRAIPTLRRAPAGMRPAVRAATLRPGARLATGLRWVSGPVYDRNRCYDAATVAVSIGGGAVRAPLRGHLCGEAGTPVGIDQPVLGPVPA